MKTKRRIPAIEKLFIREAISEVIGDFFSVDTGSVRIDDIDMIGLLIILEKTFNIDIPVEEMLELETTKEIQDYVLEKRYCTN